MRRTVQSDECVANELRHRHDSPRQKICWDLAVRWEAMSIGLPLDSVVRVDEEKWSQNICWCKVLDLPSHIKTLLNPLAHQVKKICVRSGIDCIVLNDAELSGTVVPHITSIL
jgi:hypothetical protein